MKYNFNGEELKDLDERTKNENYKLRICVNKDKLRTVKFKLGKKIIGCSQNYSLVSTLDDASENIMEETLLFDKLCGEKGTKIPDSNIDQLLLDGYKIEIKPIIKNVNEIDYKFVKIIVKNKAGETIYSATCETIKDALNELEEEAEAMNNHNIFQKILMNRKIQKNTYKRFWKKIRNFIIRLSIALLKNKKITKNTCKTIQFIWFYKFFLLWL